MIKKIKLRVEFNMANETIKFDDVRFRSRYLGHYNIDKHIADFAIQPIEDTNPFTDEEMSILLAELDEKTKSYEILEVL